MVSLQVFTVEWVQCMDGIGYTVGTGVATAQKFAQRQNYQVPKFNKKVKVNAIRLISSKEMLLQNAFQKFANFH